jgi:hypothetical protein
MGADQVMTINMPVRCVGIGEAGDLHDVALGSVQIALNCKH